MVRDVVAWVEWLVVLLGIPVALGWLLYAGWRRRWSGRAFLVMAVLLTGAWVLAVFAVDKDFHDADGWVDCWPSCSLLQRAVPIALFAGPVYLAVLAIVYRMLAIIGRPRR